MTVRRRFHGASQPMSSRFSGSAVRVAALAAVLLGAGPAAADPTQDWSRTEVREDCVNYSALRNPFFGDTHVHTKYSADAVLARTRNDPRDAYSFAQGGTVGLPPYDAMNVPGRTATIDRPLDFTAVTDHSEGFGEASICLNPGYDGYDDSLCVGLRATFDNEYHPTNPLPDAFIDFFIALNGVDPQRFPGICQAGPAYLDCDTEAGLVWQDTRDAAEENYDRTSACSFTSFVAYEWSGNTNGNNLHRNVIFRNDEVPLRPISYYEEWKPDGLWAQLQSQCLDAPGNCDVLAIPHNSNIARAGMFSRNSTNDLGGDGPALTAQQAAVRASFEPIMELTQVKGDSECRNGVGGTVDELCSFEKLSRDILLGNSDWGQNFLSPAYARGALKEGLFIERKVGVNPFALGFVGATDTHNGTPGAVSEVDYGGIGFSGVADSSPAFILAEATPPSKIQANPGGLSVLWAEENSRDALFAAMRRRETYSTSGTRPVLRSFAGRYPLDLCDDPGFVAEGYDKGVPMGGDIGPVRGKYSPRFAILAQMDPGTMDRPGTPLQRAQVVKGWTDKDGKISEQVYEVAGNPANGAGVDLDTCAETGTGFTSLCTVWEDPDFKAAENAFYYVRVVENPVCRWSKRLCNTLAVDCEGTVPAEYEECCDPNIPWTIQERAVASPIWYHPNRVGIAKGRVSFTDAVGEDKLQLSLMIPAAPATLDPGVDGLTLTLSDDATAWTATIPAAAMEVKKAGSSWSYKDKEGLIGGVTGLSVKISKGFAKITVKTGKTDLSAIDKASQTLTLDLVSGSYSSSTEREWSYAAPKLSVSF